MDQIAVGVPAVLPSVEEAFLKLSWRKKIQVLIGKEVSLGKYQPHGFCGPTEFFIFKCPHGRINIDYRHGFEGDLDCFCE